MSDKIPPLCDQPKWNHIRHRCCCVFDHDSDEDEPLAECHYHERIRARLAEAERLFKLTLRCLTDDEDGDVCHGRIRQFLRTTDADSAADSAPAAHQWVGPVDPIKWEHCKVCGVIRRRDHGNSPVCKGASPTVTRAAADSADEVQP